MTLGLHSAFETGRAGGGGGGRRVLWIVLKARSCFIKVSVMVLYTVMEGFTKVVLL